MIDYAATQPWLHPLPSDNRDVGVMAQELSATWGLLNANEWTPNPVFEGIYNDNPTLSARNFHNVKYNKLIPILLAAAKELSNQLAEIQTRIK